MTKESSGTERDRKGHSSLLESGILLLETIVTCSGRDLTQMTPPPPPPTALQLDHTALNWCVVRLSSDIPHSLSFLQGPMPRTCKSLGTAA